MMFGKPTRVLALTLLLALFASGTVWARSSGHHRGGDVSFGFYLAAPRFWPSYYSGPYYYDPVAYAPVAAPMSPVTEYVEQPELDEDQPFQSDDWQYCANPEGYYPHVEECPGGWLAVEPQPQGQTAGYWYYCTRPKGYYPYVRECSKSWQQIAP